jgi:ribosomal protein S27AE
MAKQIYKMKCPHCGWKRKMEIDFDMHGSTIPMGIGDAGDARAERPEIDDDAGGVWRRVRPCSNCGKAYDYNLETGETRKPL